VNEKLSNLHEKNITSTTHHDRPAKQNKGWSAHATSEGESFRFFQTTKAASILTITDNSSQIDCASPQHQELALEYCTVGMRPAG
jgi:hypothetical protein